MSLTRRSFVKKTSYSAAAISILGAGTALAQNISSGQQGLISETIVIPATMEWVSPQEWPNTPAGRQAALNDGMNKLRELLQPNTKTNQVWGDITNKSKTFEIEMTPANFESVKLRVKPNGKVEWLIEVPEGTWKFIYWK
jgi:hypothetical protein